MLVSPVKPSRIIGRVAQAMQGWDTCGVADVVGTGYAERFDILMLLPPS